MTKQYLLNNLKFVIKKKLTFLNRGDCNEEM